MTRSRLALAAGLSLLLGGAQAAPAHAAEAPVKRALYSDGYTDRYLLGGQWLLRRDPGDAGIAVADEVHSFHDTILCECDLKILFCHFVREIANKDIHHEDLLWSYAPS